MITDFLKTKRTKEELRAALCVLREFKSNETIEELTGIPLGAWAKLEQLEEFLDHLLNGAPLAKDTLEYMKQEKV